jgi:predicted acyl esterase
MVAERRQELLRWANKLPAFFKHVLHPNVAVTCAPDWVIRQRDLEAPTRDGTVLRLDVYGPRDDNSPKPVILSAHPYGKDNLPKRKAGLWLVSPQYRLFRLPEPIRFSEFTGWEAPDPVRWVEAGYRVVNLDLRGAGRSDGLWNPFTVQEGEDVADVIAWIAQQPWCDGNVGMLGVSYLAISQYQTAALNPPQLKAICPWEGFTDFYRDFARPGGILETGFLKLWSAINARISRSEVDLFALTGEHPFDDGAYASRRPALEAIRAPMLVCGSFSDHCLHSRGSFEAFRRAGSPQKWLWTHRGGKWSTFYSEEAFAAQRAFFDHFLKGVANGWEQQPAVRLCLVDGEAPGRHRIEHLDAFPPAAAKLCRLNLTERGGLSAAATPSETSIVWHPKDPPLRWMLQLGRCTDLIGAMELELAVEADDDLDLFVGLGKWRGGQRVGYEGSYGFDNDYLTHGLLRLSQREVDPSRSVPGAPVLQHQCSLPIRSGELMRLRIPLLPTATRLHPCESLGLELHRRWFFPRQPVTGQFPASYEQRAQAATLTIHVGGAGGSALLCRMVD